MKDIITIVQRLIFLVTAFLSVLVFIAWLFDSRPENLHLVWYWSINISIIAFLINLIFGRKII